MTPTSIKTFSKERMKMLCEILASSFHPVSRVSVTPTEPYIHRLPVELLQQIFLFVVNSAPDYPSIFSCGYDTISVNVASPPLVLTRVCHLWRVVAHSTAGVWSRIQIALPGEVTPFKPFLPHLLQCWLARSGNLPLTLRIVNNTPCCQRRCSRNPDYSWMTATNSRLLDILLSESKRWETVAMPPACNWNLNIDTPRLGALECDFLDLNKFYAPNISRLYMNNHCYLVSLSRVRIPFYKDLRHLHLRDASVCALCSTVTHFPHLETIAVDEIYLFHGPGARSYSATLESMTLPLPFSHHCWQEFIDMFSLLHLPIFRKLTLVGTLKKREDDYLLAMLAAASFRIPVLDFQTDAPLRKVRMNRVESLLSLVGEVTFRGNALQIDQYRNFRRTEKLKLRFLR